MASESERASGREAREGKGANLPHYTQISGHFVACFWPLPRAAATALANFDIFNCHCCCFSCCCCTAVVVVAVALLLAVDFQLIFHFDISICQ